MTSNSNLYFLYFFIKLISEFNKLIINSSFNFDSHLKSKHFIEGSLFSLILIDKKSYQHPLQNEWPHSYCIFFIY